MRVNQHLYKTVSYDRNKGTLTRADYEYMRDLLETVLEQLQNSELDNDKEIDQLKGVLGILPPYIAKPSEAPVCRGL